MRKLLYCTLVSGCLHAAEALAAVEIQTHYNDTGQLMEESVTTDGVLTQLSRYQYDGLGRKTEVRTERQGRVSREVTVYLSTGRVGQTELWSDELLIFRQTFLYQDGLLKSTTVEHRGSDVRTTEYTYDSFARPVRIITRDQNGKVLAQELATFPLPRVPLELELEGGLSYQSDIKVLDLEGGLTLRRNPHGAERAHDPLEMEASVSYRFSHTKEAVENSHLDAQYNLNYLFAPRAEFFVSTHFQRNQAINLLGDLELAPGGAKWALSPTEALMLHLYVAPVWHYRAIRSLEGEAAGCDTNARNLASDCFVQFSTFRSFLGGSFEYTHDAFSLLGSLEYLPNMLPRAAPFLPSLMTDSIFRATLQFNLALNERLTLRQNVRYTHDDSQALQVDCSNPGYEAMCEGKTILTETVLEFTLANP